jgi:hypothetical protein
VRRDACALVVDGTIECGGEEGVRAQRGALLRAPPLRGRLETRLDAVRPARFLGPSSEALVRASPDPGSSSPDVERTSQELVHRRRDGIKGCGQSLEAAWARSSRFG